MIIHCQNLNKVFVQSKKHKIKIFSKVFFFFFYKIQKKCYFCVKYYFYCIETYSIIVFRLVYQNISFCLIWHILPLSLPYMYKKERKNVKLNFFLLLIFLNIINLFAQ